MRRRDGVGCRDACAGATMLRRRDHAAPAQPCRAGATMLSFVSREGLCSAAWLTDERMVSHITTGPKGTG